MRPAVYLTACLLLASLAAPARATWLTWLGLNRRLDPVNDKLAGRILDFTNNHGCDNRIWSAALGHKRDVYVYLPPGYDPKHKYPAGIYLHGVGQDEQDFFDLVPEIDRAIVAGKLPPIILAVPDGSIDGQPCFSNVGSFYINSKAGRFHDYVADDVWNFLTSNFPVRPERKAHALLGASMGGGAAISLGIKHRDQFAIAAGVMPPVNLRYADCHGNPRTNFDPNCFGIKESFRPRAPVARFFGVIVIRQRRLSDPIFGRGPHVVEAIAKENPAEMLAAYNVKPGELDIFIGYGGKDEFNIDAEVESFVYLARQRGLEVTTALDPNGRHRTSTGLRLFPALCDWINPRLAPYAPPLKPPPTPLH